MRAAIAALDHLVLATPNVEMTVGWLADRTGVRASPGGQHVGQGTHNMLCSFGPSSYLEIVGPDPQQPPPSGPRPFGIDALGIQAIVAWAVRVDDIAAALVRAEQAGHAAGEAFAMQRLRPDGVLLSWRLTAPQSTVIPFLIDWGDSRHPAADAVPGLDLVDLRLQHPDPASVLAAIAALQLTAIVELGHEALLVELCGPNGTVTFG